MTRKPHDSHIPSTTPPGEHRREDDTFKRHGPEPPENDAGPSPEGDEMFRNYESTVGNVEPDQRVD